MKNIILVGFMGTGKTAVAKALAKALSLKYVSVDDLIVEREGRPITDIFRDSGEVYFRKVEKDVVRDLSRVPGQVIDTGGGVVLDPENMDNLRKNGTVICLWASPETVYERTSSSGHRPLLKVSDPLGKIRELLEFRTPFYAKADHHINTDGENVSSVVEKAREIANAEKEQG